MLVAPGAAFFDVKFVPLRSGTERDTEGREGQNWLESVPFVPLCSSCEGQAKALNFNGLTVFVPLVPQFHKDLNELKRKYTYHTLNARMCIRARDKRDMRDKAVFVIQKILLLQPFPKHGHAFCYDHTSGAYALDW